MKTLFKNWTRPMSAGFAAGCMFGVTQGAAQDAAPATAKEEPKLDETVKTEADYRNWFDVSVGGNFVKGDKASFKERHGLPQDVYGGVSDFHYEQDIGKKGLLEIDGRGIFDNEDYSLRLNLEHPGWGYVRGGYNQFRTYYDGSAGFLPSTGQFLRLYNEDLFIDRGEAWFEGQLALPEKPKFTFRYSHGFREGRKDSTVWGEVGTGAAARGIVPAFWDIDEERDTFSLDVEHTLSEHDFGIGVRYENYNQDDSRNMRRRPLEAQNRYLTQTEGVEADMFNFHTYTLNPITDTILLTTGYSFTSMDTDIFGSRIYGSDYDAIYDPLFARRQQRDEGFLNLEGGAQTEQHVANFNLMLTPWDHVTIVPSIRVEAQEQDGEAKFVETNFGALPALAEIRDPLYNTRDRTFLDISEGVELRYTGVTNWVFYARAEWLQGDGTLQEREYDALTGAVDLDRETDSSRLTQKYVAGVNWYPARRVNMSGQYYFKSRRNDYDHLVDTPAANASGNRYPAYILDQDFDTHDFNYRITVRPMNQLTFVTRYDYQVSTIHNTMDLLREAQGAESTAHIFSESVTWAPWSRLFLQGSINYVLDQTRSPAQEFLAGQLQDSEHDYVNITATAGLVVSEKTDLQAQYFVYYADNFEDNSAVSVPYSVSAEEHGVTVSAIHKITPAQQVTVRYGYFTNSEKTYGGNNDYEAHMVYSSYLYRF